MPGKMLGNAHSRGKYQSFSGNPTLLRFPPQIGQCGRIFRNKPKHTVWNYRKEMHPDVEHRQCDLVKAVEAAEHEPGWRQCVFYSVRQYVRYAPVRVVGLVAVRYINDALGVPALLGLRNEPAIGEDVIQ